MSTFQGAPSVTPGLVGMQLAPQAAQQQPLTNINVSTAAPAATQKQLDAAAIQRHAQREAKAGPTSYWQVLKPARTLKLTGAINYVNRNYAGREGANRFVYWPDFRVAGTVRDIVNAFRQAQMPSVTLDGVPTAVTEQLVYSRSIDPLNPQHRQLIESMIAQTGGTTAATAKPKRPLEVYFEIGEVLRAASKNATTAGGGVVARGAGTQGRAPGGKSPEANRARLIQSFNQLMAQAVNLPPGQDLPKILNVTGFDVQRATKAPMTSPSTGPRATAIRPVINVNGRLVRVPISAQPTGANNLMAFVNSIVSGSQYAQYAQQILQSFAQQQRPAAVGVGGTQFLFPQQALQGGLQGLQGVPQAGLQGLQGLQGGLSSLQPGAQGGFAGVSVGQAQPTISVMGQLGQQGAGTPRSPGTPSSGAVSPAGPSMMGGQQLPQFGQGPAVSLGQASLQMPGGGLNLPQVQGLQPIGGFQLPGQLPTVAQVGGTPGGIQLPRPGTGASGFPQINIPGMGTPGTPGSASGSI